jgi:hypothetical protein
MITNEKIIHKQIDNSYENEDKYYGMSYADGVRDALEWILSNNEDNNLFADEDE